MHFRRLALTLVLLGSCSRAPSGGEGAPPPSHGALVARVGTVELREDDVQRAIARDPAASTGRFESPAARREFIEGLVRFELLAQAAERGGFTRDPDAVHAMRQIAVTKLVNKTLGEASSPDGISRADVEREYAARQATEFTLPPAFRVRRILVSDAKRAADLVAQAKALEPADDRGFAALAATHSEDLAARANGGDLGFIDKGSHLPAPIVEAALKMSAPGEVVGPLRTEQGFEILRLVSLRAAAVSPLSSVDETLRQRLYRDRRAKALDGYLEQLRKDTPVEIVEPGAPQAKK